MRRAVFLDRDGVLNEARLGADGKSHPPGSVSELVLTETATESCELLRAAGFLLIVVTNQPDVARGTQTEGGVAAINAALRAVLPLDDVLVCLHDDRDGCDCRKPKPGLLLEGARRFGIDLAASVMVGDRSVDIEAGRRAGCRTALVGALRDACSATRPDFAAAALLDVAHWIVGNAGESEASRGSEVAFTRLES